MAESIIAQHRLKVVVVGQGMRARTYQRHVTPQHIQELRQFVDTRRPEQASNHSYARVVALRLDDANAVLLNRHGPEFQYDEMFAVESLSGLPKNYWAGTVQFNRHGSEYHKRQEKSQHKRSQDDVHDALNKALQCIEGRTLQFDNRPRLELRPSAICQGSNAFIGHQPKSDGKRLHLIFDEFDSIGVVPRQRQQYLSAIVVSHKIGCRIDGCDVV
jgi:hypothetical protein